MSIENMSIQELESMESCIPEVGGFPSRVMAATRGYDTWISKLYSDIDHIIKRCIFPTASYRQNDPEDRYNVDIANTLSTMGYQAHHDKWKNGHPDIVVESHRGYQWIGESKIHSDYNYLLEGFRQLTTRYSSGFIAQNHGAILIITKNRSIKDLMSNWENKLISSEYSDVAVQKCTIDDDCFISTHTHQVSGSEYTVRHIPISILFNPTDKSARKNKA
ncbi:hypothetical protein [Pseudoalteromonas sp. ND6B]|uniref:hypothetical protein n=1 Tax=Pseudoalteromonas sp. ND6B TaxID=1535421 RepID=UPI00068BDBFF|nr:hypothetical protein [Pseudoalteromonas sp. ND6B]